MCEDFGLNGQGRAGRRERQCRVTMAADLAQYDIDLSCYDWLKQKLSIIDAEGQWKDALVRL